MWKIFKKRSEKKLSRNAAFRNQNTVLNPNFGRNHTDRTNANNPSKPANPTKKRRIVVSDGNLHLATRAPEQLEHEVIPIAYERDEIHV